jgi:outer membrane beta-barrel protein
MKKHLVILATFTFVLLSANRAIAQADTSDDTQVDINQIENEIEKNVQKDSSTLAPPSVPPTSSATTMATPNGDGDNGNGDSIHDLSDLATLAPFSDVSVIQRKFLPKTERFQLFGGAASIMNDPWFTTMGFNAKIGYFFTEQWGVELEGLFLGSSKRDNINQLQNNLNVNTSSIITIKGYYGASVVWSPIYGKMGMFGKKIVPFDMFFDVGGGTSQVSNGTGGTTLHFGTGQIFSISKSLGFRWDLAWHMVQATPAEPVGQSAQNFNNILLSAGFSYFFPEAGYR